MSIANDEESKRFLPSVGSVALGLGGFLGISAHLSTTYLSSFEKAALIILLSLTAFAFFDISVVIFVYISHILDFPKKEIEKLESFSRSSFTLGMYLAIICVPYFFISEGIKSFGVFFSSNSHMIRYFFTIGGSVIPGILMFAFLKRHSWIVKKLVENLDSKTYLIILVFSSIIVVFYTSNCYEIAIETEIVTLNGEGVCLATVRATGFASVNAETSRLRIRAYDSENQIKDFELTRIEEDSFFARIPVSELGSGLFYIEFSSGGFRARKILVLDDCGSRCCRKES